MGTMKRYMESPLHEAFEQLAQAMGIPSSCVGEVVCVDCGKKTIAANCFWCIGLKNKKGSGPHCGCLSS